MTAEQKDTISNITTLAGVAIGSSTGEVTDAVNAGETAKVAVEDNHLSSKDTQARESWKQQLKQCKDSRSYSCMKAREEIIRLNAKDTLERELLIAVCNNNPNSSDCTQAKQEANNIYNELC